MVLKPEAVLTLGPSQFPLNGGSGWSAQRLPLPGPDVWVHTEPAEVPDNAHCNPQILTPGMRLNAKVPVQDTVAVVTKKVRVKQSSEAYLEVLPGSAVGRAELDGRARFWAGDVRVIYAGEIQTGEEYQPGKRSWEVGDGLKGSGPVVGNDEVWEVEGGRLATEIQPLLVEMRTSCVKAIGLAADPVQDLTTWNAHLNVPVEPYEAEVWVVPEGALLTWPDGTPAGEVVTEALFPLASAVPNLDRVCATFGLGARYVDPLPGTGITVCFSESSAKTETRASTLLAPIEQNYRSTALLKKNPIRHPGKEFGKPGSVTTCDVKGTVKNGKLTKPTITGCGEVYVDATKTGLARWRWDKPVVNGERVSFEVSFSVDIPYPD